MPELAHLRWFGYAVRMGDDRYHKRAWQDRTHGKRPQRRSRMTRGKRDTQYFERKGN